MGGVFVETPDRIWIAQRGELPLPQGAQPFTPDGMPRPPPRSTGDDDRDGTRGWQRRYHHSIIVVDSQGRLVDHWPQVEARFDHRGGRGPHQIKMSPYDPAKHVWIVDDQMHQIHNANPLENIRNTREIDSVSLGGVKLDRNAMLAKWKQGHSSDAGR